MFMTTALGTGTLALAAAQGRVLMPDPQAAGPVAGQAPGSPLTLVDDDGDDGQGGPLPSPDAGGDDDDDDGDGDGDCAGEDGEDDCAAATSGPGSKAGTAAPPRNGLFTNGTAPVVKSN
jgi:hypothetical protein